ncbi:MAG: DUF4142 domain-containing protein [Ginsengibacter sp.]
MKKISIATAVLFTGGIFFGACNGNNSSDKYKSDSTTTTTTTNMANDTNKMNMSSSSDTSKMTTSTLDDGGRKFIEDAAHGGLMEVDLGNAAMKSDNQQIKDFGKMMVDDHSKLNDELKEIAGKKNVQVPTGVTSDQQKEMDKLTKKTGNDFDKSYVKMMVDDHKKDIDDFKKASKNLVDSDLKNFAVNALPTLQKHLDAIQAIQKKM